MRSLSRQLRRRLLFALLLGLDALRGMRNAQQTLLGDEFSRGLADAVGLVLDTHERHFEVADEFHLVGGQPSALLLGERRGTFFEHLERRRGILRIVVARMGDRRAQQFVVGARRFKLFQNQLLELGQFRIAISGFLLCHNLVRFINV